MIRTGTFRYVPWSQLDAYHSRGWMAVADLGFPHSIYATLMWRCDCPEAS